MQVVRAVTAVETDAEAHAAALGQNVAVVQLFPAGQFLQSYDRGAGPLEAPSAGRYATPRPARDVSAGGGLVLVVVGDNEREGHDRRVLILRRR